MSLIVTILLAIVLFIVILISAGYIARAAAEMRVGDDPNQKQAHKYLATASIIAWVSVALILVAGGLFAYFGNKLQSSTFADVLLVFIALLFIINGVYAALGAYYMKKGADFAYNQRFWAWCRNIAIICLGTVGVVILILIIKLILDAQKRRKAREAVEFAELYQVSKKQVVAQPKVYEVDTKSKVKWDAQLAELQKRATSTDAVLKQMQQTLAKRDAMLPSQPIVATPLEKSATNGSRVLASSSIVADTGGIELTNVVPSISSTRVSVPLVQSNQSGTISTLPSAVQTASSTGSVAVSSDTSTLKFGIDRALLPIVPDIIGNGSTSAVSSFSIPYSTTNGGSLAQQVASVMVPLVPTPFDITPTMIATAIGATPIG